MLKTGEAMFTKTWEKVFTRLPFPVYTAQPSDKCWAVSANFENCPFVCLSYYLAFGGLGGCPPEENPGNALLTVLWVSNGVGSPTTSEQTTMNQVRTTDRSAQRKNKVKQPIRWPCGESAWSPDAQSFAQTP